MSDTRGKLTILACRSGKPFAEKIVKRLNRDKKKSEEVPFIDSTETHFANSELKTVIDESIRGADVYIVQDCENSHTNHAVDVNLRALKTAIDAAWRSDANCITAVVPAFPYARQDKSDEREGITAAMVAREIEDCNADHVITMDVHNTAIAGFFRKAKFENLKASRNIVRYIRENPDDFNLANLVVLPCDPNGAKRIEHYADVLEVDLAFTYKQRDKTRANSVKRIRIMGELEGKDALVIDDMICTGGSMESVIKCARDEKGAKRVYAACSLPLFNGDAAERLERLYEGGYLTAVIGTDAVYHGPDFQEKHPWFREVSVSSYFAKVIRKLNQRESISELLK